MQTELHVHTVFGGNRKNAFLKYMLSEPHIRRAKNDTKSFTFLATKKQNLKCSGEHDFRKSGTYVPHSYLVH